MHARPRRLATLVLAAAMAGGLLGAPPRAAAADLTVVQAESLLVDLMNAERARVGVAPVKAHPTLMSIARVRSEDMAAKDYFSHTHSDGRSVFDMIAASGITWYSAGEIIAWNNWPTLSDSAAVAVKGWLGSDGHRKIMLSSSYNYVGVGLGIQSSTGKKFWTAVYLKGPETTTSASPGIRQAGTDRYATAAAISRATFAAGVPVAYVALGRNYPDALAAGPAAARLGGPVLLVASTSIPAETAIELARLKPKRIVVVGGTSAVSDAVVSGLGKYASGGVSRQAGSNRYATAAAISRATFGAGVPVAYVALGSNYPDALAAGPAAARLGGPLLLVAGTSVPPETATELARLKPGRIVVVGATSVVSDGVLAALRSFTPGSVSRQAGANRYATAAAISKATFGAGVPVVYVALGPNFPDALAAGPAAAKLGGPVLLVKSTSIPSETAAEIRRLKPGRIILVGSRSVVSDAVLSGLNALR